MSYPRDLDEYTDAELRDELANRQRNRDDGLCDYCLRAPDTAPCRFPERHAAVSRTEATPEPWRLPGCCCPGDARRDDRCDLRWTRCNERLGYQRTADLDAARQRRLAAFARKHGLTLDETAQALTACGDDEARAVEWVRTHMRMP